MKSNSRFAAMLSVLFLALMGTAMSPVAHAESCSGKLVGYESFKDSNANTIAQIQVYYDATSGKNCAVTKHGDVTWGKALQTQVVLNVCENSSCSVLKPECKSCSDSGVYKYEAGPVRVYGRDQCVFAAGGIRYGGTNYSRTTKRFCD